MININLNNINDVDCINININNFEKRYDDNASKFKFSNTSGAKFHHVKTLSNNKIEKKSSRKETSKIKVNKNQPSVDFAESTRLPYIQTQTNKVKVFRSKSIQSENPNEQKRTKTSETLANIIVAQKDNVLK